MAKTLTLSGSGQGTTWDCNGVGLGAQGSFDQLVGTAALTIPEQPVALAFCGNLYNLKESFPADPATHASLDTILHLYLQEGLQFVHRLRGDFALAVWDGRTKTLSLVVDRFRVCPLFYYYDHEKIVFASRLRGILACPLLPCLSINPEAIADVISSSIIPTPKTIFQEIKKLPPGHILIYRVGAATLQPYWDVNFLHPSEKSETALAYDLRERMTEAVAVRLRAERPLESIGTFLSGGIDSSTITGVLTELTGGPVKSFSIGFEEQRFNEMHYAQLAAQAFAAEHYTYFVTPQDTYAIISILLNTFDEPYANASAVPTYYCAKLAREHGVTALYAGDGGDELFAGNERYAFQRVFDHYHKIPAWLRKSLVEPLVFGLERRIRWNILEKGKKYIQKAVMPYPDKISSHRVFKIISLTELFDDGFLETIGSHYDPDAPVKNYYHQAPASIDLDRHLYLDLKLAISDNDVFKVVGMTGVAGVSVSFPFLDHQLAEFAASVPAKIKMKGTQLRSFFKRAYADMLPAETIKKTKHGFGLPIPVWLRTDKHLNEMMRDLLFSAQSLQRGYFRKRALEDLIEEHKKDETSFYGALLWNLMMLELWHRNHSGTALHEY